MQDADRASDCKYELNEAPRLQNEVGNIRIYCALKNRANRRQIPCIH